MQFKTEQQLFDKAITSPLLKNMVGSQTYRTYVYAEPKGLFGIPDLVIVNLEHNKGEDTIFRTFAFEMKLSNWKRALTQAYRYYAFANLVFVVIDRHFEKSALENIDYFVKSNIGLISLEQSGILHIHYAPEFELPYSYELKVKFTKMVMGEQNKEAGRKPLLLVWDQYRMNEADPQ